MSLDALRAVWSLLDAPGTTLSSVHRLVLLALADHAGPHGDGACPSPSRLARRVGVSPRRVQQVLLDLAEAGVVTVTGQHRYYRTKIFSLALPALESAKPTSRFSQSAKPTSRFSQSAKPATESAKLSPSKREISGGVDICTGSEGDPEEIRAFDSQSLEDQLACYDEARRVHAKTLQFVGPLERVDIIRRGAIQVYCHRRGRLLAS